VVAEEDSLVVELAIVQEVDAGLDVRVLIRVVRSGAAIPDEQNPAIQRVQLAPRPGELRHGEVGVVRHLRPFRRPEHLEHGRRRLTTTRFPPHDLEQLASGRDDVASADELAVDALVVVGPEAKQLRLHPPPGSLVHGLGLRTHEDVVAIVDEDIEGPAVVDDVLHIVDARVVAGRAA